MYIAKPTEQHLRWYDQEFGVLIHYSPLQDGKMILPGQHGDLRTYNPPHLDPEQWVRAAWKAGAKYAILVAKQCSFAAWPTKENDYSIASTLYKDGKGDVVQEFIDACKKYDIRPGFYYHTTRYDYYGIDNQVKYDYKGEEYQTYVRHVENQLKELMTEYGEISELWFDGGLIPVEEGGPDVLSLLQQYQPNCITFQGPPQWIHNIRWVGNEEGLAPETCWSTTFAGEARFDGTIPDEQAGIGAPDGKYFWPAEADVPNRTRAAESGGWNWAPNEGHLTFPVETLLRFYTHTIGHNANLLIGMAISEDGLFEDEEQFAAFGELLRNTFGTPVVALEKPVSEDCISLNIPEGKSASWLVIREDITEGQRIRGYAVYAGDMLVCENVCVGHKCIIPLPENCTDTVSFRVTQSAGEWKLRDIALF